MATLCHSAVSAMIATKSMFVVACFVLATALGSQTCSDGQENNVCNEADLTVSLLQSEYAFKLGADVVKSPKQDHDAKEAGTDGHVSLARTGDSTNESQSAASLEHSFDENLSESMDPQVMMEPISRIPTLDRSSINDQDVVGIVTEPRCHVALPLVVANMRARLPTLPIQLFYSDFNEQCIRSWFDKTDRMVLTKLGPEWWLGSHDHRDQNWLYTNPKFWELLSHDKALVFHSNTWICDNAESKLGKFLKYDFVGAPWSPENVANSICPSRVGNGGLSIRTVKVMKETSLLWGQTEDPDDVYFCEHLLQWPNIVLPSKEEAGEFSVEEYDAAADHAPVGEHNIESFEWQVSDDAFHNHCTGFKNLLEANEAAPDLMKAALTPNYEAAQDVDFHEAVKKGREFAEDFAAAEKQREGILQRILRSLPWQAKAAIDDGRIAVTMSTRDLPRPVHPAQA